MSIKFGGSWYMTVKQAASAWAATALPDVAVIERDEDASAAAAELEAFCWREAQRIGDGAPEDVDEATWRDACREALAERIKESRV